MNADGMVRGGVDRRSLLIGAGAAGLAAGLGASGALAQTPKPGGRFRIGASDYSTSDSLDPQLIETRFQLYLGWQLHNCLVEVGPGGVLVPELAESWEASADLRSWVFKLRRGVEFHNGKTLDAEDVVYSLNLHRGDDTKSMIKSIMAAVTDVKASAPGEVTVTLASANAGFPSVMSQAQVLIVPAGTTDFSAGIGTGGYSLIEFEPGVRSLVTKNPNYWKEGRAHFDEVEILAIKDISARNNAILTDEVDAINFVDPKTAPLLERNAGVKLLQTQGKAHYTFSMRVDDPLYENVDVRTALKLAIDRQDVLDKILTGYGSLGNDQPLSPAYAYFNTELPQRAYDPEAARALMKKAGAENATFTLHAADTPFAGAVDAAQLYAEHAAEAGIRLEVVREPDDGYWSNVWGVKPFFASRWSGRANEDLMLSTPYTAAAVESGWNATRWVNERFEAALAAARSELDPDRRRALYWECQSLLRDDGGLVVPVFADFIDAARDNVMHGELSSDWDLDGARASERWWFA
jgi:peptide/nickel transport system substrate-binding protein